MEERLRLYRAIITHSQDAVAIYDTEGRYLEQNPAHRALLGFSDEELIGQTPALHCGEQQCEDICEQAREGGSFRGEVTCRTRSGVEIQIELSAFPVRNESGELICSVGFARDITTRKQRENRHRLVQKLREQVLLMTAVDEVDEVDGVLITIGEALKEQGIGYENCGINVLDTKADPPTMRSRSTRPSGGWLTSDTERSVQIVRECGGRGSPRTGETWRPRIPLTSASMYSATPAFARFSMSRSRGDAGYQQHGPRCLLRGGRSDAAGAGHGSVRCLPASG